MFDLAADVQQSRWYVLFVQSNQEKKVGEALRGREVENVLPCYLPVRQLKNRRVKLDFPLFPGYVFVHLALANLTKALTVPNIVSAVGTRSIPSAISEIAWIKLAVEQGNVEPHSYLKGE